MSDAQLRDEVMTLFLAGHETTALALSWACYLLALNPHVEAMLLAAEAVQCADRGRVADASAGGNAVNSGLSSL